MTRRRCSLLAMSLFALLVTVGCFQTDGDRIMVQGVVTYQGNPVTDGVILFEPLGKGRQANGTIQGGRFTIESSYGLTPGEYRVEIEASGPSGNSGNTIDPGALYTQEETLPNDSVQILPARFNRESELRIVVDRENHTQLEFHLD